MSSARPDSRARPHPRRLQPPRRVRVSRTCLSPLKPPTTTRQSGTTEEEEKAGRCWYSSPNNQRQCRTCLHIMLLIAPPVGRSYAQFPGGFFFHLLPRVLNLSLPPTSCPKSFSTSYLVFQISSHLQPRVPNLFPPPNSCSDLFPPPTSCSKSLSNSYLVFQISFHLLPRVGNQVQYMQSSSLSDPWYA